MHICHLAIDHAEASHTVFLRWSATDTRIDGSPYQNHGVHIVTMRWGKVVDIDANEDSQAVVEIFVCLRLTLWRRQQHPRSSPRLPYMSDVKEAVA